MMKPIDLYVAPPSPACRAVILAAKYLNINVKLIHVDLMKGEQKEDWFVKMNPQHCLPTINDNGFVLWESRAIMSYLANKYAPNNMVYPRDAKKRGIVDRFMQFDLNVLNRTLGDFLIPIKGEGPKFLNTTKERKVIAALNYLDSVLAKNRFVADNHITLADFSIYCSLEFANDFKYDLSKYRNINRYYQRLKQTFNDDVNHQQTIINNIDVFAARSQLTPITSSQLVQPFRSITTTVTDHHQPRDSRNSLQHQQYDFDCLALMQPHHQPTQENTNYDNNNHHQNHHVDSNLIMNNHHYDPQTQNNNRDLHQIFNLDSQTINNNESTTSNTSATGENLRENIRGNSDQNCYLSCCNNNHNNHNNTNNNDNNDKFYFN